MLTVEFPRQRVLLEGLQGGEFHHTKMTIDGREDRTFDAETLLQHMLNGDDTYMDNGVRVVFTGEIDMSSPQIQTRLESPQLR